MNAEIKKKLTKHIKEFDNTLKSSDSDHDEYNLQSIDEDIYVNKYNIFSKYDSDNDDTILIEDSESRTDSDIKE